MTTTTRGAAASRRKLQQKGRPGPPPVATTTTTLYRQSVWLFVAFALAMLVAFWPSYFSRLGAQPTYHAHAHGLAMTLWCALLIAQAWLIRSGRRDLHRRVGSLSFVLVPLIAATTINFLHFRLRNAVRMDAIALYFMALVLNALAAFLVLYGLAMYHRRQPPVHARYMVCTIFPLFTPVTDRLFGPYMPSVTAMVPRIDGMPILPVAGFVLANVMLVALAIWDRRTGRHWHVFPVALAILLLYHVSVLTFHRLPLWQTFGEWFVRLPLS